MFKIFVPYNIYSNQKTGYTFSIKMNAASCIPVDGCSQCTAST